MSYELNAVPIFAQRVGVYLSSVNGQSRWYLLGLQFARLASDWMTEKWTRTDGKMIFPKVL